jgi:prepilin-type processing-associated H-X9-DG protein
MLLAEEASANTGITDVSIRNRTSTDDAFINPLYPHRYSSRHLEGSNILFLDGHVKFLRPERIDTDGLLVGSKRVFVQTAANPRPMLTP